MAEWLCSGLQSRLRRFDSGFSLHVFMKKNKALFLDRDGVININYGYVHNIEEFNFIKGIFNLVRKAKQKDYLIIIVTNQAGIGRGYYTEGNFLRLMEWVKNQFKLKNGAIDAVYYCPFHPVHGKGKYKKNSNLRKPNPGMILKAQSEHNINLSKSILIGDQITDIDAGKSAGVGLNILFKNDNKNESEQTEIIHDISEAIKFL